MFFESIHRESNERRDGAVGHGRDESDEADLFLAHSQRGEVDHLKKCDIQYFYWIALQETI